MTLAISVLLSDVILNRPLNSEDKNQYIVFRSKAVTCLVIAATLCMYSLILLLFMKPFNNLMEQYWLPQLSNPVALYWQARFRGC
jgi:uncharacterized integral membrane protein